MTTTDDRELLIAAKLRAGTRDQHTGINSEIVYTQTFDVLNDPAGARDTIKRMSDIMLDMARELEARDG